MDKDLDKIDKQLLAYIVYCCSAKTTEKCEDKQHFPSHYHHIRT